MNLALKEFIPTLDSMAVLATASGKALNGYH